MKSKEQELEKLSLVNYVPMYGHVIGELLDIENKDMTKGGIYLPEGFSTYQTVVQNSIPVRIIGLPIVQPEGREVFEIDDLIYVYASQCERFKVEEKEIILIPLHAFRGYVMSIKKYWNFVDTTNTEKKEQIARAMANEVLAARGNKLTTKKVN